MQHARVQITPDYDRPALRPARAEAPATEGVSEIGDLWRILWCRRWLVAGTVAVCTLATLAYVVATPLEYTAVAQILIDPRDRQIVSKDVTPDTMAPDGGVVQIESQSRVIESDAVLLRAVRALGLASSPDYGLPKTGLLAKLQDLVTGGEGGRSVADDEDRALRVLRKHLAVKRADKVFVVDIVVTAASGQTAATIANAIAEAYLADQSQARARASTEASEALSARLDELRAAVQAAAEKVQAYRVAHDLLGTDKQLISDQQLTDNGAQLDAARAKVAELQARADQIDALRRAGGDGGAVPEAIQSSVITQLRASQSELVRKRSDMRTRYGDRFPDLVAVNAEIDQAHRQIEAELDRLARAAHSDLDRARKNERALETSQSRLKLRTASSDEASISLQELVRDFEAKRAVYQSFLARAGETREQATVDNTNARIISRPIPPVQPSWPLRAILLLGSLAAGLGLGAALAFVAEYAAPTILSAGHLEAATGAPVIGTVSNLGAAAGARRPAKRRGAGAPDGLAALQLGLSRLCGPLSRLRGRPRPHTVLVATAGDMPGAEAEVADALVRAAMASGASTLLVEGRAREAGAARGLIDVLAGRCRIEDALVQDEPLGHYHLPFGTARSTGEVAATDRNFGAFLDQAGRIFDLVVFEGDDLAGHPAAAPIAQAVDDILFVAQRGLTARRTAAAAADAIAAGTGRGISAALLVDHRKAA